MHSLLFTNSLGIDDTSNNSLYVSFQDAQKSVISLTIGILFTYTNFAIQVWFGRMSLLIPWRYFCMYTEHIKQKKRLIIFIKNVHKHNNVNLGFSAPRVSIIYLQVQ